MALLATTRFSSDVIIQLAETKGVVVSIPEARHIVVLQFYNEIVKLSEMKGAEFDRVYLLHEIQFHTNAMNAVKKQIIAFSTKQGIKAAFPTSFATNN